jgi:putative phosphoribosyl transferase
VFPDLQADDTVSTTRVAIGLMDAELRVLRRLEQPATIPAGAVSLEGSLAVPEESAAIVAFAHGSGSGRHSPRNRFVAEALAEAGFATLLFDLLTEAEELAEARSGELRFDIRLLAERLSASVEWLDRDPRTEDLPVGLFGASTGAAAALEVAAARPDAIGAVVSRGGRPDLAPDALPQVKAPTLLIVGGEDRPVIEMNQEALHALRAPKQLEIVPGATHLFEEPGALEGVADLARDWFLEHLSGERADH